MASHKSRPNMGQSRGKHRGQGTPLRYPTIDRSPRGRHGTSQGKHTPGPTVEVLQHPKEFGREVQVLQSAAQDRHPDRIKERGHISLHEARGSFVQSTADALEGRLNGCFREASRGIEVGPRLNPRGKPGLKHTSARPPDGVEERNRPCSLTGFPQQSHTCLFPANGDLA